MADVKSSFEDITVNLPSLQFESALTDEQRYCLPLRARSHALTVNACAQATYFVSILNEARQITSELRNPKQGKAGKLLQEKAPRDPLLVGIIGCGKLGSQLANCLLAYGDVRPEELKISTRRPETLVDLQNRGVRCMRNNKKVANSVHLLFFCVLPSQLPPIAEEILGQMSNRCILYSFVHSLQIHKLKHILKHDNIIKPDYSWDVKNAYKPWDFSLDVNTALENSFIVEKTCPLSSNLKDAIVVCDPIWTTVTVYAVVNMCTQLQLTRTETIDILLAVVFGYKSLEANNIEITETDLIKEISDGTESESDESPITPTTFPMFDIIEATRSKTPLQDKLSADSELRTVYTNRYTHVFRQYIEWKKFSEGLQGMSMAMGV